MFILFISQLLQGVLLFKRQIIIVDAVLVFDG